MNRREIQDILDTVSYKPGWRFMLEAEIAPTARLVLSIQFYAVDAKNPGQLTTVHQSFEINNRMEKQEFIDFIALQVEALEKHEMFEWLKFSGANYKEPHP